MIKKFQGKTNATIKIEKHHSFLEIMLYTTVDRVKLFIKFKGISLRKFAEIIGVSHSLINNTKSLGSDKLESIIINFPEINPIWLLTGKGEMLIPDQDTLWSDPSIEHADRVLPGEAKLLKEMNLLLHSSLQDKERLIKLIEVENQRLRASDF